MSRHVDEMEISVLLKSKEEERGTEGENNLILIQVHESLSLCYFPVRCSSCLRKFPETNESAKQTIGLSQSAQIQSVQAFTFLKETRQSVLPRLSVLVTHKLSKVLLRHDSVSLCVCHTALH